MLLYIFVLYHNILNMRIDFNTLFILNVQKFERKTFFCNKKKFKEKICMESLFCKKKKLKNRKGKKFYLIDSKNFLLL